MSFLTFISLDLPDMDIIQSRGKSNFCLTNNFLFSHLLEPVVLGFILVISTESHNSLFFELCKMTKFVGEVIKCENQFCRLRQFIEAS